MKVTIYFNSSCSKCRATLQILKDQNIEPGFVYYLETPPDVWELKQILEKLNKSPQEIIRFKDSAAQTLELKPTDVRPLEEWLTLMHRHPQIIERPIVVSEKGAVLGRPPENVLTIL